MRVCNKPDNFWLVFDFAIHLRIDSACLNFLKNLPKV